MDANKDLVMVAFNLRTNSVDNDADNDVDNDVDVEVLNNFQRMNSLLQ